MAGPYLLEQGCLLGGGQGIGRNLVEDFVHFGCDIQRGGLLNIANTFTSNLARTVVVVLQYNCDPLPPSVIQQLRVAVSYHPSQPRSQPRSDRR